MAKIPHRPEPTAHTDYNVVLKRDAQIKNRTEESALFKNAIRLADERNSQRANNAIVQGGEKSAKERNLQLSKGSSRAAEQTSNNKASIIQAQSRDLAQQDTAADQLERGTQDAILKTKKRGSVGAQDDGRQVVDSQSVQLANALGLEQQTLGSGIFNAQSSKKPSQDMGQFESIQSACQFLQRMGDDASSSKAWRFSLPGDEFVKGVHMEQSKGGGWSITVASDEEHTDALNEHLDSLVTALEDSGMTVKNIVLS